MIDYSRLSEKELTDYVSTAIDIDELRDLNEEIEEAIRRRTKEYESDPKSKISIIKRQHDEWFEYMRSVQNKISDRINILSSYLIIGKSKSSCELALKAALEVIKTACQSEDEPSIIIRRGFPKESCRSFLINVGITLEEMLFNAKREELDIELADDEVFDLKRTRTTAGFICEGRITYLYLAKRSGIHLEGLKQEWQNLSRPVIKEKIIQKLISRTDRMFPKFKVLKIEFGNAAITPETVQGITKRTDVDMVLRVTVYGSRFDMEEQEQQPRERRLEVMYGKRGESVEHIKKELYTAYEQGYDKYILIADNGEHVILNVEVLMREPRRAQFDKDVEGYIRRLLKNPTEG